MQGLLLKDFEPRRVHGKSADRNRSCTSNQNTRVRVSALLRRVAHRCHMHMFKPDELTTTLCPVDVCMYPFAEERARPTPCFSRGIARCPLFEPQNRSQPMVCAASASPEKPKPQGRPAAGRTTAPRAKHATPLPQTKNLHQVDVVFIMMTKTS